MAEKQPNRVEWNGVLTINFAPELGSTLDELENEYDELITNFQDPVRKHSVDLLYIPKSSSRNNALLS